MIWLHSQYSGLVVGRDACESVSRCQATHQALATKISLVSLRRERCYRNGSKWIEGPCEEWTFTTFSFWCVLVYVYIPSGFLKICRFLYTQYVIFGPLFTRGYQQSTSYLHRLKQVSSVPEPSRFDPWTVSFSRECWINSGVLLFFGLLHLSYTFPTTQLRVFWITRGMPTGTISPSRSGK